MKITDTIGLVVKAKGDSSILSLRPEQLVFEALETMAYTRFVLQRGLAGDLLYLQVALAPCLVGYGESGERLLADPTTRRDGNPYGGHAIERSWIHAKPN